MDFPPTPDQLNMTYGLYTISYSGSPGSAGSRPRSIGQATKQIWNAFLSFIAAIVIFLSVAPPPGPSIIFIYLSVKAAAKYSPDGVRDYGQILGLVLKHEGRKLVTSRPLPG